MADAQIMTWGDQGDGTYRNPVLKCDFSDPDVTRVGDDFYMTASDFHYMGMQVLHSKDLVNWKIICQVFDRLSMDPKYDEMRAYGEGTWAPSLRYRKGEFYLYVCTPMDGLFLWKSKSAAGPWGPMITVKKAELWEDPCPFWDEFGVGYLFRSKKGAGPIIVHKMSEDGTRLLDEGVEVYNGKFAEGPKVFRRRGYYYIVLPEGGVAAGWQTVLRSKNIYGPYERKEVLPALSPHQGGLVELPSGESWFICFKLTGWQGRITHLLPVKWGEDDWPVFGDAGNPVAGAKKPKVNANVPIERPETSDEFDSSALVPVWQWNHNPINEAWSLTERPGWLRLKGLPAADLKTARNTLTQKLWDEHGLIDIKIDPSKLSDGQRAGLAFLAGDKFGWVGALSAGGVRRIAWPGGTGPEIPGAQLWLRGIHVGEFGRLLYSTDGMTFADTGQKFEMKYVFWKGSRPAIFCFGAGGGWVDVDYFHYQYSGEKFE